MIGNPVKFGLSFVSMFFDVLFMYQHYVLYPDREDAGADDPEGAVEDAPLLGEDRHQGRATDH